MPDHLSVRINGNRHLVARGTTVAAAMLSVGVPCRLSVTGAPRTALCGMGTCFECRAVVDGIAHQRTCQMLCREGMTVTTQ